MRYVKLVNATRHLPKGATGTALFWTQFSSILIRVGRNNIWVNKTDIVEVDKFYKPLRPPMTAQEMVDKYFTVDKATVDINKHAERKQVVEQAMYDMQQ